MAAGMAATIAFVPDAFSQSVPPKASSSRVQKSYQAPQFPDKALAEEFSKAPPAVSQELSKAENITFTLAEARLENNTVYPERVVQSFFAPYIGKKIRLSKIFELARELTLKYREDGYIFTQVIVPPQTIENGVVKLEAVEGFVHRVNFRRQTPIDAGKAAEPLNIGFLRKLARRVEGGDGEPLRMRQLERFLLLVRSLPGMRAKTAAAPSEDTPRASDLYVRMDRQRFEYSVAFHNRGTKFTGPLRLNASFTINGITSVRDKLTLTAEIAPTDLKELQYLGAEYSYFLNALGTRLKLGASHSATEGGSTLALLEHEGETTRLYGALEHPILLRRKATVWLGTSFEHQITETDLLGTQVTKDELSVLRLYSDMNFSGKTATDFNLTISRGIRAFGVSMEGSPNLSRAGGQVDFTKISGTLSNIAPLGSGFASYIYLTGQYSFDPLLLSEQFGLGGPLFGRAYDPSELTGDTGLGTGFEIRKNFGGARFQFFTFADWGFIKTKGVSGEETLASVGGGLRINFGKGLFARVELAYPLKKNVGFSAADDPRVFFSVNYAH